MCCARVRACARVCVDACVSTRSLALRSPRRGHYSPDDPASAAPSGPNAVIARAEELHRNRMETTKQRNYYNSGNVERAETAYARGAKRTPTIIFSGCDAQAVHRRGRTRSQEPGVLDEMRRGSRRFVFFF